MKKIVKVALFLVICLMFSSVCSANIQQYQLAKEIASSVKETLEAENGRLPIKFDDVSYLMNITSDKQYIVYDFKTTMNSKAFPVALLTEAVKTSLKDDMCNDPYFEALFRQNNLLFLYRFEFSDQKTIPIKLSAVDICGK